MSDRTSAGIFRMIFKHLAEDVEKNQQLAEKFYEATSEYDFNQYQMYCDDELLKFGLAKLVEDPDSPGQKIIEYK